MYECTSTCIIRTWLLYSNVFWEHPILEACTPLLCPLLFAAHLAALLPKVDLDSEEYARRVLGRSGTLSEEEKHQVREQHEVRSVDVTEAYEYATALSCRWSFWRDPFCRVQLQLMYDLLSARKKAHEAQMMISSEHTEAAADKGSWNTVLIHVLIRIMNMNWSSTRPVWVWLIQFTYYVRASSNCARGRLLLSTDRLWV